MSEPQYQGYFKRPREVLGPMASQYWAEDPKLLGIHLARYKFVSKMLAGKKKVAEIGCGDAWFSRVVEREVGELHLFDFDKKFIDHIYSAGGKNAYVHDILTGPLEYGLFDGIYSLDCFEHIERTKQDLFIVNARKSLQRDGCFIVGVPSLESQAYASEASKIGHVGCLSERELKTHLEYHFSNVFSLGFSDESLTTGFGPMRHYNIMICTGPR